MNVLRKTTFIEDILECRQLHLILEWYSKNKKTSGHHIKKYFSKQRKVHYQPRNLIFELGHLQTSCLRTDLQSF